MRTPHKDTAEDGVQLLPLLVDWVWGLGGRSSLAIFDVSSNAHTGPGGIFQNFTTFFPACQAALRLLFSPFL